MAKLCPVTPPLRPLRRTTASEAICDEPISNVSWAGQQPSDTPSAQPFFNGEMRIRERNQRQENFESGLTPGWCGWQAKAARSPPLGLHYWMSGRSALVARPCCSHCWFEQKRTLEPLPASGDLQPASGLAMQGPQSTCGASICTSVGFSALAGGNVCGSSGRQQSSRHV